MGIIAKANGGDFEQVPAGSYIARCYKMVDVGTQEVVWNNDTKYQRQVYIYWELLVDEDDAPIRMKDDRPFGVSNRYTLSVHPKANLRQHIDAWRGRPFTDEEAEAFDITNLLGTYCRLQVANTEKNGKTYTNVQTVAFTKKKPEGVNPVSWWSVEEPDMDALEKMPEWLRDKINASEEMIIRNNAKGVTPEVDLSDEDMKKIDGDEPINLADIPF